MQLVGARGKVSISSATIRRHSPNTNAREKNERSQTTEMNKQEGAGIAYAIVQIVEKHGNDEKASRDKWGVQTEGLRNGEQCKPVRSWQTDARR